MLDELDCDDASGDGRPLVLQPTFTGEAFLRVVNYPVIVEAWDKRTAGRVRRAYLAEFTEAERATLARYYAKFYRWHLVTGTPRRVMLRLATLHLLQRAAAFFGTI